MSCQSKILPRCHNSLSAHSVPSESCWGLHSPNPAMAACAANEKEFFIVANSNFFTFMYPLNQRKNVRCKVKDFPNQKPLPVPEPVAV